MVHALWTGPWTLRWGDNGSEDSRYWCDGGGGKQASAWVLKGPWQDVDGFDFAKAVEQLPTYVRVSCLVLVPVS